MTDGRHRRHQTAYKNARGSVHVSRETFHKTPRLSPRSPPRQATRTARNAGKRDGERSDGMGRTASDDTECPSRSDSDCGGVRYTSKNIEKARGESTGTAQEVPERRCGNVSEGRKRRRDDPPGGSRSGPRDETMRYGT